jgi:two-component system phosphate regulon response regulator PhoB
MPLEADALEGRGRIVVIEDDGDIGEALSYSLRRAGFHVRVAVTGKQGFYAVCRGADLVILDLNLPDEDGLEVCLRLRRRPGSIRTPILVASARGTPNDRALALAAGADDYLVKPYSMRDLVLRCRATMRHGAGARTR